MKLLFFIHSLEGGGAQRVVVNLANHFAGLGWEVRLVTLANEAGDVYALSGNIDRVVLDLASESATPVAGLLQNLRRIKALRRILRQTRPDVAVAMMATANILLAFAAFGLSGIRTIGSERIHPPQSPLGGLWEMLRRFSYAWLDAVVALTGKSADWIWENTRAKQVVVIPNAATWPLPKYPPHLPPEVACKPGRQVVLGVGRLDGQKGFDWLIDAFAEVAQGHPQWDLVIVGDGPQAASLRSQIDHAGLAQRVFLPGRVGNVSDWYARADLYVLSSRYEGFPNTLIEAMAQGLPVISFDCDTGPADLVRQHVDGILVKTGDVQELAFALQKLMDEPQTRGQLAARAVEVRERFSMDRVADLWSCLFQTIADKRDAA